MVGEAIEGVRDRDTGVVLFVGGFALGSSFRFPTKMAIPSASQRAAIVFIAIPSMSSAESSGT